MRNLSMKKFGIVAIIATLALVLTALCACSNAGNDGKIVVKDVQRKILREEIEVIDKIMADIRNTWEMKEI